MAGRGRGRSQASRWAESPVPGSVLDPGIMTRAKRRCLTDLSTQAQPPPIQCFKMLLCSESVKLLRHIFVFYKIFVLLFLKFLISESCMNSYAYLYIYIHKYILVSFSLVLCLTALFSYGLKNKVLKFLFF